MVTAQGMVVMVTAQRVVVMVTAQGANFAVVLERVSLTLYHVRHVTRLMLLFMLSAKS